MCSARESNSSTSLSQSEKPAASGDVEKLRREYQDHVDQLTAKLITTEDAVLTQREEFLQMRAKWNEMKGEVETIPVLKAQVRAHSHWVHQQSTC